MFVFSLVEEIVADFDRIAFRIDVRFDIVPRRVETAVRASPVVSQHLQVSVVCKPDAASC
jgi:hypothetical protein